MHTIRISFNISNTHCNRRVHGQIRRQRRPGDPCHRIRNRKSMLTLRSAGTWASQKQLSSSIKGIVTKDPVLQTLYWNNAVATILCSNLNFARLFFLHMKWVITSAVAMDCSKIREGSTCCCSTTCWTTCEDASRWDPKRWAAGRASGWTWRLTGTTFSSSVSLASPSTLGFLFLLLFFLPPVPNIAWSWGWPLACFSVTSASPLTFSARN